MKISFNKHQWVYIHLFKFHFVIGRWWGNVRKPALVIEWRGIKKSYYSVSHKKVLYPAWAVITFRDSKWLETIIYWRGWFKFDWNCEWLARKFDTNPSYMDNGDYWYEWKGHTYI